jgi:DNA-binding NarL/FixJ family response regulator
MAEPDARYAVVIESHHPLAEGVADCLRQRGYIVGIAGTHASGAAWAASREQVHFLAASVPAMGESPEGAYLAQVRAGNPALAILVMTSDSDAEPGHVPRDAISIRKPFSFLELADAISRATASVAPIPSAMAVVNEAAD